MAGERDASSDATAAAVLESAAAPIDDPEDPGGRVLPAAFESMETVWLPDAPAGVTLTIDEFRRRVIERNEKIQVEVLGVLIAEKNRKAAVGAFEPEFVSDVQHIDSKRPNTAEQSASQQGLEQFNERNNLFTNGIETLLPTNGRVRLGFNVFDLRNNLQANDPDRRSPEYSLFVGANLTQPLLKNAGFNAGLAAVRLAAMESDLAYEEYRRQLMATLATAEASYWNTYLAGQELRFSEESLELARSVYDDTKATFEAGTATEYDLLSARVAVLEREANLATSRQQLFEAVNAMVSFYSGELPRDESDIPVTAPPPVPGEGATIDRTSSMEAALASNPDYLRRQRELSMENIRVAYAKTQDRVQLDLKASYGLNGLGNRFGSSFDDVENTDYPAWSVGAELRVPLAGGITAGQQLDAAEARKMQAILGLKQLEVQLLLSLENAIRRLETTRKAFEATQATVVLNENLLRDEGERVRAGRSDIRQLFEVEQDLFESKIAAIEEIVRYQAALLEYELVVGSLLADRGWERSRDELKVITARWLETGIPGDSEAQPILTTDSHANQQQGPGSDPTINELAEAIEARAAATGAVAGESAVARPARPAAGDDDDLRAIRELAEAVAASGSAPRADGGGADPEPKRKRRFRLFGRGE